MKKILFPIFAFFLVCSTISAQIEYETENEGWTVDLEAAYAEHKKTGKPIMANFTGSDWCGWCIRLSKAVFVKDEFKEWADENVILLELDFPRRKKLPDNLRLQNQNLQQAFGVRGFPTVWVFDINKDEKGNFSVDALGKTGYAPSVEQFTGAVEQMFAKRKSK